MNWGRESTLLVAFPVLVLACCWWAFLADRPQGDRPRSSEFPSDLSKSSDLTSAPAPAALGLSNLQAIDAAEQASRLGYEPRGHMLAGDVGPFRSTNEFSDRAGGTSLSEETTTEKSVGAKSDRRERSRSRRRMAEEASRSGSARVLTGTVLSGGVQPEGGVRISVREAPTLFDGSGRPLLPEVPFREWTFTSSLGHFEVEAAPGQTLEILAEAIGFAPTITRVLASSEVPTVIMQPAGGVTGTVRSSADGAPIGEARIHLRTPYGSRLEYSGDEGEFSFQGLAPGSVVLEVTHPNFQPHLGAMSVAPGEGSVVEILLQRGDLLMGQVLAPPESGEQDLSGILVHIWDLHQQVLFGSTVTDVTGEFSFASLTSPGQYRLTALAGPLGSGTRVIEWTSSMSGMVLPLQLELPWDLLGRVVDEAGMPIAKAFLELRTPGELSGTELRQVQSDNGGNFRLSGLGRHSDHQLSIYHAEFSYGQLNSIRAESHAESELVITLPKGVRILGSVSTPEAPLPAGALIRLRVDPIAHLDIMTLYTYSGEGGVFAFPAIPPATCRLTILSDGHLPHMEDFIVAPHQQEIFRNVVLALPDAGNR